ncbi:PTS fructose transporter subunit IIABC [Companilactobacillus sp.]|jgi:PTS system fructose-specific IIC component|uniref:PTS fructose transporter subunit IIABC n=1 Tax=Companilactobacillus sp. TaxID=2767905 RepID=UPI0025BDAB70|nr:fructose-specific PTS transporter subunit EIIC [Companilactobacillus sp.]MCH4008343.1 fructose-specific PTS transporter subunit EIIC [Companilactobacillus sp.]MCH4051478.1 fructose-specific PTS transporter subunit EIIC [Companilactobacillus sp.]MCH4076286.1 fructose-specific PTS transporter subunit EIIC [Companilactobacillus sp.]MCH4124861.1 fructose-specific PTS transporter subunit EIIC [Companilactobacillus sp.]MCH4131403.1 fructose-specific PTS transporter subunit EIIC [Companilactobacil
MDLKELLLKDAMIMDLKATTKAEAIDEMVSKYFDIGVIDDKELYKADILKREAQTSTGIGDGIAMPHARDKAVKRATVLFAKSKDGIDYDSLDGQPTYLFFMIAAPDGADNLHLQALAALSSLLINPDLVANLKKATTADEVQKLFNDAMAAKEAKDKADEEKEKAQAKAAEEEAKKTAASADKKPFVVAVTACPTGIAHTYMAEAALKEHAEKLGVDIKVETNGSEGVKHKLTAADIARADGVIIAADKKVDMPRFDGKHLVNRPVTDGINKSDELINLAVDQKAPIFHAEGGATQEEESTEKKSLWSKIYADLMNGISNMLPFVVGGGILMALSFLLEPGVGSHSQWFLFFNNVGNYAFSFLIPVLAAYIAESIGDRPALLPGFVGGYMASQASASVVSSKSPAGFIGGLLAGFIAGWVVIGLKKLLKGLPKTLDGLKPILLYPVLGLLATGAIMYFAVDPIFAVVNHAITAFLENMGTGNAVILGGLLGGMMAVDMGGPFNKAAYTFAIGTFTATQNGALMAAVMVGGMIPPLAIAIATTFWGKKFTEQERQAGLSNYVLGISFITEGAIPFAAGDPLHVIVSSVIGAVIGGGLTQLWHVNVPAPHGGIFVTLLANHPLLYVLAVVIGAVIAGVIYGVWKPALKQDAPASK